MKVLISGAGGMLARAFLNKIPTGWEVWAAGKNELDITNEQEVRNAVGKFSPKIILNCAAFTRVDECEEKRDFAFAVNCRGAGYLAEAAHQWGAYLVHFSTDYIFDGTGQTPYYEDSPANPLSVYGVSKWEGECLVRKYLQNYLLIRTQWLYGQGGNHFVKTILKLAEKQSVLKVVDDQIGSPTWTEDLSEATLRLIEKRATGEYHLVNEGHCSWYQFSTRIVEEAGLSTKVIPCSTKEFPRPARRPAYSVLSTNKAKSELGWELPNWETALKRFMRAV
ncbi:MAG: dTDP-4-dehydrorhamnose reductase [Nitrospirae bacterium]|nr:dTDP-4-dehydrorhamnose reductase [Candidatus Manganitrophaceae bacterium]